MRVAFLLFILGTSLLGLSTDTPSETRIPSGLLEAREKLWRAWFAGDTGALRRVLPEDLIAINANLEEWRDRNAELAASSKSATDGVKLLRLTFPAVRAQVFGDVVVLYSKYELELEINGRREVQSGRATEVFVRRNGTWINPGWHMDSGK